MNSLCVLFILVCEERKFIILIRGSTPLCASLSVEWKMTLKFIKLPDCDGRPTFAHNVSVMWFWLLIC